MNFNTAQKQLERSYVKIKPLHSKEGHAYIETHWNRYVNQLILMPYISKDTRVLEVGASILSAHLRLMYGCQTTVIYHELEPEWRDRCDCFNIQSFPVDLMRDNLPVDNNSFDLILFNEVYEHFPLHPEFFIRQLIQKLANTGELFFSVPNFASSEKRLKLLLGKNPQDCMDKKFIYYAHHREPVMKECCTMIRKCGGNVFYRNWFDLDDNLEYIPSIKRHLFHLYRKRFHPLLHLLFPPMRKYIVIRARRKRECSYDPLLCKPPFSDCREFGSK